MNSNLRYSSYENGNKYSSKLPTSLSFKYDKNVKSYFPSNKSILVTYSHPKEEFIQTIPVEEYSCFKLYNREKKTIIKSASDFHTAESFLYTNYPYSNEFDGGEFNKPQQFRRYQFHLKNVVCYCEFNQLEKSPESKEEGDYQYAFLHLPCNLKESIKLRSDRILLEEGYNHKKNELLVGDTIRYYRIFEICKDKKNLLENEKLAVRLEFFFWEKEEKKEEEVHSLEKEEEKIEENSMSENDLPGNQEGHPDLLCIEDLLEEEMELTFN